MRQNGFRGGRSTEGKGGKVGELREGHPPPGAKILARPKKALKAPHEPAHTATDRGRLYAYCVQASGRGNWKMQHQKMQNLKNDGPKNDRAGKCIFYSLCMQVIWSCILQP